LEGAMTARQVDQFFDHGELSGMRCWRWPWKRAV